MSFHAPNSNRVNNGRLGTTEADGNNGLFLVRSPSIKELTPLRVIASNGLGWEHVSVSLPNRCPTWAEMCKVKSLFWDSEDTVMQLHPPESEWVNNHSYCLHLWRPMGVTLPTPPGFMVGIKDAGVLV